MLQSGSANLLLNSSPGAHFENLSQGTYTLSSDAGIAPYSCCSATVFDNSGLFQKTGGSGDSVISAIFNDLGGTINVQTGTLTLANNGTTTDGTFDVAAGATLDVTGGSSPTWAGHITGTGGGTVLLAKGTLAAPGASLNFPNGMFQWTSGTLQGPLTNLDVVTLSGTNPCYLDNPFYNLDLVRQVRQRQPLSQFLPGRLF